MKDAQPKAAHVRLSEIDAHTFERWISAPRSCVLLPVGAHEQHGAHLPMGTDAMLSAQIAEQVAARTNARVAQPFTYGYKSQQRSGGGDHLVGTVSLDGATLISLTRTVIREYLQQGADSVVLINGHFENYQFLYEGADLALDDVGAPKSVPRDDASASPEKRVPTVLLLSYWDFVADWVLGQIYPTGFPGWEVEHGGVLETSLMLYLRPDLVDMAQAQEHHEVAMPRFDRLPAVAARTPDSGCLSAPTGSDAAKGKLLFHQVVEDLVLELTTELDL